MINTLVTEVNDVQHSFRPAARAWHGGLLSVEIEGKLGGSEREIKLQALIKNAQPQNEEQSLENPYYASDTLPYAYRVNFSEHKKLAIDKEAYERLEHVNLGKAIEGPRPIPIKPRNYYTVDVQIYLLRGLSLEFYLFQQGEAVQDLTSGTSLFGQLEIRHHVYVVQDVQHLPASGEPLETQKLYPVLEYFDDEVDRMTPKAAVSSLTVKRIPNGALFTWFATGQTLRVEIPDPMKGSEGFSFSVAPDGLAGQRDDQNFPRYDNLLSIRATSGVSITLSPLRYTLDNYPSGGTAELSGALFPDPLAWSEAGYPDEAIFSMDFHRPIEDSLFFRLERVKGLDDLGEAEGDFFILEEDDEAREEYGSFFPNDPLELTKFYELLMDIGLAFIPIVGDVVDFADFNLALRTGKNKWGHKVDDFDLFLMGIAVIPLVGDIPRFAKRISGG